MAHDNGTARNPSATRRSPVRAEANRFAACAPPLGNWPTRRGSRVILRILAALALALPVADALASSNAPSTLVGRTLRDNGLGCGGCHVATSAQVSSVTTSISGLSPRNVGQTSAYFVTASTTGDGITPLRLGMAIAVSGGGTITGVSAPLTSQSSLGGPELIHANGGVPTSLTQFTAGGSASYQFNYTPPSGTGGTTQFLNASARVGITSGGGGWDHADTFSVVVNPVAPTISSFFGAATIPLNGTTTRTITITNPAANGVPLSSVAFTNALPSGLVVATPNGLSNTCGGTPTATAGASSYSLSGASVGVGSSCTVTVTVRGTTAGAKADDVFVSSGQGNSNTSTPSVTVVSPPTFSKAFGAASIPLNGSTSLSFTIQNLNASQSLSGIGFTDTLPSGLVVANPNGLTGSCGGGTITATAGSGSVSLSNATLAASSSCNFSVNVTGTTAGAKNNTTGNVTSTQGGAGGTASATLNVIAPPSVAKSYSPTAISVNGTSAMTLAITNPAANVGLGPLTGVAITDTLPSGLVVATPSGLVNGCGGSATAAAGSGGVSLSGALVSGTCTLTVSVTSASAGTYTNTTGVVSSTNGGTGNTASATLTVAAGVVPPTILAGYGAGTIPLNGTTSFAVTITNPATNGVALSSVGFGVFLDPVLVVATPSGLTSNCGGTATATAGASDFQLVAGTIPINSSCTFTVNVTGTTAGAKSNIVQVASAQGISNFVFAGITVVSPPTIGKAFGAASIPLGSPTSLTYTIQNTNTSNSLSGVGFTDTLPFGLVVDTPNGLTGSCGGGTITAGSGVVSLSNATLAQNSSCNFSVNVFATTAGLKNSTTGNITSTQGGAGGTASANLTVVAPPSIAKAFAPTTIAVNGTSVLTLTITNPTGDNVANIVALTGVTVTDTLPSGLVVATPLVNTCGGTAMAGSGSVSLTGGSIAVSASCTLTVSVTSASAGTYNNTTGVVSSTNGSNGNTASATLTVANQFALTVTNSGGGSGLVTSTPSGIDCGATCSANFNSGESVSLGASPSVGSTFTGWSGGGCTGNGACNVTMDAAKTVTATFDLAPGALTPSPASLDFGGQSMNTTAPSLAVTLTNGGGSPVPVNSVTASTYFAVTHDCGASVAAGASCTANITFTPTAEGSLNGTLTVASSLGDVTVPLAGTGERSLVTHYYRAILRRAPDAGGKAFWESEKVRLPALGANVNETWYAMATFFFFSSEYQSFNRDDTGFVTDLYNTFFNRGPDGGGLAFWTGQLSQGMPREVVLVSFMFSTEFQGFTQAIFGNVAARKEVDTVVDFYRGLLSRLPDDGGFASWVGQFRAAQCAGAGPVYTTVESISSGFANGGEYAARNRTNAQYVGDLYNAFLRRGGDLGGVQFWINEIATGARTRAKVRQDFIASPEFTNRVNAIIAEGCIP